MFGSLIESQWKQIWLLGVKIDTFSLEQFLSALEERIASRQRTIISYVNVHAMNISYSRSWFQDFLNKSDLTFCDGVGIKLAARMTGQRLNHRFTPPDFMETICNDAVRSGWRIFFLGAKEGVAQRAATILAKKYPGLQIRTHHGYFEKNVESPENRSVVDRINKFHPDILVLGFGMPLQEKWIIENITSLNSTIFFPAGALFDYLSGEILRAPRWMTDNGLEWLGRLFVEPRRLWKRYVIGNPLFFWRIFKHHFLGYPLPK